MFIAIFYGNPATAADKAELVRRLDFLPPEIRPDAEKVVASVMQRKNTQKRHIHQAHDKLDALGNRQALSSFSAGQIARTEINRVKNAARN